MQPRAIIFAGLAVILASGALVLFSNRDSSRSAQAPAAGVVFQVGKPSAPGGRALLLGSMHMLPASGHALPAAYREAVNSASEILFEIDPAEKLASFSADLVRKHSTYADGSSWRDHVSSETAARVDSFANAEGIDLDSLTEKRIYVVAQFLGQYRLARAGYGTQWGVEALLSGPAAQSGATVGGLETLESQLEVFSSLDEASEESLLNKTLDELETREDFSLRAAKAWWEGDADRIGRLTAESMAAYPELARRLYTERNERIAKAIEVHLKPGESLVVVIGAAHLCGDKSVTALLGERGFSVSRVLPSGR